MTSMYSRRILVIDDQEVIHYTFQSILGTMRSRPSESVSSDTGGSVSQDCDSSVDFEIDFAFQGEDGLNLVRQAEQNKHPYAMAFVDRTMPPGIDGIETIDRLWQASPDLQVVLCTAVTDFSWTDVVRRLGRTDKLLILKKPFDAAEVLQMAAALTKKWQLARQVHTHLETLEDVVIARTAEIERAHRELLAVNEELAAAKNAAEAANRAKSEFLANMSHELRTPMAAILGFGDVLMEYIDQPEALNAAKTIRRNGNHLLNIINDILDLSKIEAGKLDVERVRCSPCGIVTEVASLMRVRAESQGLPLEVEFQEAIPEWIHTDPTRLRQILVNLVGNAIKFTESGVVKLSTRLLDASSPEPRLEIAVIDTGIGMTQDQVACLFQPFVQADLSTTRKFGGTGLGLTISLRMAQLLGGTILVECLPNRGCTFRLTVATGSLEGVRLLNSPAEAVLDADAPSSPDERGRLACRVLLAEDGIDNQRLITFILRKAGADVTIADNGRLALEQVKTADAQNRPFDVILMDMQMPEIDGYEATNRLRQAGYDRPIIALTAHAMKGDREQCLMAGCDDYAAKPINSSELVRLVAKHTREGSTVSAG
jgi:two-component system, sensor histidine kinase and response regulator